MVIILIRAYNADDFTALYDYYSYKILSDGFYVLQDAESFKSYLTNPCFISINNGVVEGFILGSLTDKDAYVDIFYGEHDYLELLQIFESHMKNLGITTIWFSYKSPIKKPFYVFQNHIHANAQGLSADNPLLSTLVLFGYNMYQSLSTYHLNLSDFILPNVIKDIENTLSESNIKVAFYNKNHLGIEDFYSRMDNIDFETSIRTNLERQTPNDLLVCLKDNHIIGFAGPLSLSNNRGVFHGIFVLGDYQGLKIGKLLFFKLCDRFKQMNASYVTLFTGDNNPARFLYQQAGFIKLKTFWMLKKEL